MTLLVTIGRCDTACLSRFPVADLESISIVFFIVVEGMDRIHPLLRQLEVKIQLCFSIWSGLLEPGMTIGPLCKCTSESRGSEFSGFFCYHTDNLVIDQHGGMASPPSGYHVSTTIHAGTYLRRKLLHLHQYGRLFCCETRHPLVNIVDFDNTDNQGNYRMTTGLYAIFLNIENYV